MNWTDLAGPLAKIGLTALGTAVAGPAGGALGGALGSAIANSLGTEPTPEAVKEAIDKDPDGAASKLQPLDAEADALLSKQVDLNMAEAESPSMFVAGARPSALWTCVAALAYQTLFVTFVTWLCGLGGVRPPPVIDNSTFDAVLYLLFGLAGVRGVERIAGVARDRWSVPAGPGGAVAQAGVEVAGAVVKAVVARRAVR